MTEQEFLENYDMSQYDRPSVTSDIVLLSIDRTEKPNIKSLNIGDIQILLIKRAQHPFMDKWALPGVFCQPTESVYETAKRALSEETNVTNAYLELTGVHSDKNRDPRGWIISNSWLGLIDQQTCSPRNDANAWEAAWFTIKSFESKMTNGNMNSTEYTHTMVLQNPNTGETLLSVVTETLILSNGISESIYSNVHNNMAFDHNQIITQAFVKFRESVKEDFRPIFNMLPEKFTLGELQATYEKIVGGTAHNFRRTVYDYVVETDEFAERKGFRPAKLFLRNPDKFKHK